MKAVSEDRDSAMWLRGPELSAYRRGATRATVGSAMSDAITRARADLAAGRPWKARDRLRGVIGARPTDQTALALLGDVLLDMGDEPEAGRWLFLSERDDEAAERAREAFRARFSFDQMLRQIPAY